MKKLKIRVSLFFLIFTACSMNVQNDALVATPATPSLTPSIEDNLSTNLTLMTPEETHSALPATEIRTTVIPTAANIAGSNSSCPIGTGLRIETVDVLLKYKDRIGMVMSANIMLAKEYFPLFDKSIRLLGAPSLYELGNKGELSDVNKVPYEGLAYGLETNRSTPEDEWREMLASTQKAKTLAKEFNKLLVMAPGLKLMSGNEELYEPMVSAADIWIFQTQQIQKNPPGIEYRVEVERIVDLIRAGNPDIEIWAQITLLPDREPNAGEWLNYRESIMDLVDGTYIGVYTWDIIDNSLLTSTIDVIFEAVCSNP